MKEGKKLLLGIVLWIVLIALYEVITIWGIMSFDSEYKIIFDYVCIGIYMIFLMFVALLSVDFIFRIIEKRSTKA